MKLLQNAQRLVGVVHYLQRYQQVTQANISRTAQLALNQLNYTVREYTNIQDQLFSVVNLLSHGQATHYYARTPSEFNQLNLETIFVSVAENQKWYNSILFLDVDGQVKINVDYSSVHQRANVSDSGFLYPHRDLRRYAERLGQDQVGIWGMEGDKANFPPSLQLLTPITIFGQRYGYIVVDVDLWRLSHRLNYALEADFQPKIMTDQGVYLSQRLAHSALMKPDIHVDDFSAQFPDTWQAMLGERRGYRFDNGHLIVFHRMELSELQTLYLVINLTPDQLAQRAARDLNDLVKGV